MADSKDIRDRYTSREGVIWNLRRVPPIDIASRVPNELHNGLDCLLQVLRHIYSQLTDYKEPQQLQIEEKNPILKLAWRSFLEDCADPSVIESEVKERYAVLKHLFPG